MALLGCAGRRPSSRSSGGRVDSSNWFDLLASGGENVQDLALGGRRHPDSSSANENSSNASVNDPKAQQQRQEQEEEEERQRLLDIEELQNSMPQDAPFGGFGGSHSGSSSSNSSRSSSRKARLLSRKVDSATSQWPATTSTDSSNFYGLLTKTYKSSSGSGSSGGGGPPGEGGGRGASANAGGCSSSGNSGGGAPWEHRPPYQGASPSVPEAGGTAMAHDGVTTSNSRSINSSNGKFDFGGHPLRQPSFEPNREIGSLPSAQDICADPAIPGIQHWGKAAAVTITTTISTSRIAPTSVTTTSGGVFVGRDHDETVAPTSSPSSHGGPIAPAPAPRVQPSATARPPAPIQHERKPSYNLLAMMIPDISKFSGPSAAAAPLHAPGAVPGAASGGAAFPAARVFAPASAAQILPADSYLRVGVEDGGIWTRQVSVCLR